MGNEQSSARVQMEDRLRIAAIAGELMEEKGDTVPLDQLTELVSILPQSEYTLKTPFFGRKKEGGSVEGHAPGMGNVSVGIDDRSSDGEVQESRANNRFGLWELAHPQQGLVVIEHMWSHHLLSKRYSAQQATLLYRMVDGVVTRGVLVRFRYESFPPQRYVAKRSENLSADEAEQMMNAVDEMRPKKIGTLWTPVFGALLATQLHNVERYLCDRAFEGSYLQFAACWILISWVDNQSAYAKGWRLSLPSRIIASVYLTHALMMLFWWLGLGNF